MTRCTKNWVIKLRLSSMVIYYDNMIYCENTPPSFLHVLSRTIQFPIRSHKVVLEDVRQGLENWPLQQRMILLKTLHSLGNYPNQLRNSPLSSNSEKTAHFENPPLHIKRFAPKNTNCRDDDAIRGHGSAEEQ